MRPKFIESGAAVSGGNATQHTVDIPRGVYAGLLLVLKGTTDTAQTLTAADVGRIRIERNGRQIQSETFEFYHQISNLHHGFITATLPAAGATRIAAFVPFYMKELPNVLEVPTKEALDVHLTFGSNLPTRFGSNAVTWELYGIEEPAMVERYEMIVEEQDEQFTGATTNNVQLHGGNIARIYIDDSADDIVTRVQMEIDGRVDVSNLDPDVLLDLTNLMNEIESAGTLLEVSLVESGLVEDGLNKSAVLTTTVDGAGTVKITKLRINTLPAAQVQMSAQRATAYRADRVKNRAGS